MAEIQIMECEERPEPKLFTLRWSCGLAIGPPRWQGTEIYESPECPGEGEIVVEESEFEVQDGRVTIGPCARCTLCHQSLEESDHFEVVDREERRAALRRAAGR